VRQDVSSNRQRSVRSSIRPRPLPKEFRCIDQEEAVRLFDYLNSSNESVDKEAALAHLALCFHCQEAVARLIKIDKTLLEKIPA